ncbi:cysteine proteinase [Sparassis latifolia]
MLASPILPSPGFSEEATQYRPAKDIEAFNSLLPPPIEFVEGSSTGALAIPEGKYQPINATPKPTKVEGHDARKGLQSTPAKSPKAPKASSSVSKPLYDGAIPSTWPEGMSIGSGLNNTGNTCFLNSALQCLIHTPPLVHVLMAHSKTDPCRVPKAAFCMSCALRQVMYESHSSRRPFTPYPITTKLQVIAKHLRRGRQEDSHEFLRYAVDALQKSCLAGYGTKIDHKLAETTWVHKIFGGQLRSRVQCLQCGYNSDTFDSILDLSIDIYGVTGLKEALRKFVAVDHLKGADKYKCEKCKKAVTADKQLTIQQAPMVLTIHLKRFSPMGRKIGHVIKYEEHLSLQPVMSDGQHGPSYTLFGVISHAGSGPNSGHYYAHAKGANGLWYEMNDESVVRYTGVPTSLKNAYMLFYVRDRGQALEAVLNAPARPPPPLQKAGIIASMKKRKVIESDDEEDDVPKAKRPSIGPRLPSPPPSSPSASTSFIGPQLPSSPIGSKVKATEAKQQTGDPQAERLKKKIAAVSQSPGLALQSFVQYDESDDDIGEKVEDSQEPASSAAAPLSTVSPPERTRSSPLPPPPPSRKSAISASVPTSSFYGTPSGKSSSSKKRKSPEPDHDDDDSDRSLHKWARTPLSPGLSYSSSARERRESAPRQSGGSGAGFNPYSGRMSSNLQHRERDPPIHRYGRQRRRFAV